MFSSSSDDTMITGGTSSSTRTIYFRTYSTPSGTVSPDVLYRRVVKKLNKTHQKEKKNHFPEELFEIE